MQDKDILFEELMSNYISGSITDEEKVSLFALVEESDLYRERYNEMVKLYALLHIPAFESQERNQICLFERMVASNLRSYFPAPVVYLYTKRCSNPLLMVSVSIGSIFIYNELDESGEQLYNEMAVPLGSQNQSSSTGRFNGSP